MMFYAACFFVCFLLLVVLFSLFSGAFNMCCLPTSLYLIRICGLWKRGGFPFTSTRTQRAQIPKPPIQTTNERNRMRVHPVLLPTGSPIGTTCSDNRTGDGQPKSCPLKVVGRTSTKPLIPIQVPNEALANPKRRRKHGRPRPVGRRRGFRLCLKGGPQNLVIPTFPPPNPQKSKEEKKHNNPT